MVAPVPGAEPGRQRIRDDAYHVPTERIVLSGGWNGHALEETWTWDGVTWHLVANYPAAPEAQSGAMAYHPATGMIVEEAGAGGTIFFDPDDEATYDRLEAAPTFGGEDGVWDGTGWGRTPSDLPNPPRRVFAAMAEDARGQVVFFGGFGVPDEAPRIGEECIAARGFVPGLPDVCIPWITGADSADQADTWTLVTPGTGEPPRPRPTRTRSSRSPSTRPRSSPTAPQPPRSPPPSPKALR